MTVEISIDSQLEAALETYDKMADEVKKAAARALNRTITTVRAESARMVSRRYNIKVGDVKDAMHIFSANSTTLQARASTRGRFFRLINFGARPLKRGVSVAVTRGRREVLQNAFIAQMKSGHIGVFTREEDHLANIIGKRGKPIKKFRLRERYTISIPGSLGVEVIEDVIRKIGASALTKNFEHELSYRLNQKGIRMLRSR